mgnify:CR=1 FL=1
MKKRESFNNKWGFVLACIGSAVGMGNIWMFPTRVSLYGGGSYLIPYFIFVILIGFTGVIGEMSFGRATKSGPVDAFVPHLAQPLLHLVITCGRSLHSLSALSF